MLHKRNNFEFTFKQLVEEDYCPKHHHNKADYRTFRKLAKSILASFSLNCSKSSHFTFRLIQFNEYYVIMVFLIYLSQNSTTVSKVMRLCNFNKRLEIIMGFCTYRSWNVLEWVKMGMNPVSAGKGTRPYDAALSQIPPGGEKKLLLLVLGLVLQWSCFACCRH